MDSKTEERSDEVAVAVVAQAIATAMGEEVYGRMTSPEQAAELVDDFCVEAARKAIRAMVDFSPFTFLLEATRPFAFMDGYTDEELDLYDDRVIIRIEASAGEVKNLRRTWKLLTDERPQSPEERVARADPTP